MKTTTQLLTHLIGFDTVSRESNLALVKFIGDYLASFGINSERIGNADGSKANLLARIGPEVAGGVVLSGHTDIVPVDGQPWSSDPFTLTDKQDGRLYGRGCCDMKGFIACALAAVPKWLEQDLQRPIYLALSYDEEIGCVGAPSMIAHMMERYPRPALVVVGEPTMMAPVVAHKGITTLRTQVTGKEAHSSQVNQGVSAIHVAARLITRIEEIMTELQAEGRVNPAFNVPHSSLHVGTIKGGTAVNIMARDCQFEWEIRHLAEDGFDGVFERFQNYSQELQARLQQRAPGISIVTEALIDTVPAFADHNNQAALALCTELLGEQPHNAVSYATEAGQFQRAGLPTVICGPGSIAQAHQPDEFIEISQLEAADRFMARLGEHLARA